MCSKQRLNKVKDSEFSLNPKLILIDCDCILEQIHHLCAIFDRLMDIACCSRVKGDGG